MLSTLLYHDSKKVTIYQIDGWVKINNLDCTFYDVPSYNGKFFQEFNDNILMSYYKYT